MPLNALPPAALCLLNNYIIIFHDNCYLPFKYLPLQVFHKCQYVCSYARNSYLKTKILELVSTGIITINLNIFIVLVYTYIIPFC